MFHNNVKIPLTQYFSYPPLKYFDLFSYVKITPTTHSLSTNHLNSFARSHPKLKTQPPSFQILIRSDYLRRINPSLSLLPREFSNGSIESPLIDDGSCRGRCWQNCFWGLKCSWDCHDSGPSSFLGAGLVWDIEDSVALLFISTFFLQSGGGMDFSRIGEKVLSSVRSARSLGFLPASPTDRPEVCRFSSFWFYVFISRGDDVVRSKWLEL